MVGCGLISGGLFGSGLVGCGLISGGVVGSGLIGCGLVSGGLVRSGLLGGGLVRSGLLGGGLFGSSLFGVRGFDRFDLGQCHAFNRLAFGAWRGGAVEAEKLFILCHRRADQSHAGQHQ